MNQILGKSFSSILVALLRRVPLIPGIPILIMMTLVHFFEGKIRIAWISTSRIGHFVDDVCMSLAAINQHDYPYKTYFCKKPWEPVSNDFWLKIFERNVNVKNWLWVVVWASEILKPYTPPWLIRPPRMTRGSRNLDGNTKAPEFLEYENQMAKEWLMSRGWTEGEPIVCLMVRDSKYLDATFSARPGRLRRTSFDYHSYRDSAIEDYIKAAEWLAEKGFWVLRMGKVADRPLRSKSTRVIDYANAADRSDLLDVWLFASCALCITTGTGPDAIARNYGRPILSVNFLPLVMQHTWSDDIIAPKSLFWQGGERLSLLQHIEASYTRTEQYAEAGIEIRDLTDGQILRVVKEAWAQKGDTPMEVAGENVANEFYFALLKEFSSGKPGSLPLHSYRHPKARLSFEWLKDLEHDFRFLDRDWLHSK